MTSMPLKFTNFQKKNKKYCRYLIRRFAVDFFAATRENIGWKKKSCNWKRSAFLCKWNGLYFIFYVENNTSVDIEQVMLALSLGVGEPHEAKPRSYAEVLSHLTRYIWQRNHNRSLLLWEYKKKKRFLFFLSSSLSILLGDCGVIRLCVGR